ncbi:MAG: twin-arginine translocase subunit TatC [Alphaproteobacteria bacterium]|nr:twin-arginine translocase subunit TatC [Alphaproteobacteria bacterium]
MNTNIPAPITHPHPDAPDPTRRPLTDHLVELRRRLLWSFVTLAVATVLCFLFVENIYGFLVAPLANAMGPDSTQRLIYTGLTEAFFTYMKVAFFAGLFITFPIIATQLYRFLAPGLYARERRAFLPFLMATPILFLAGAAFVYYFVMPMAWKFFLGFQSTGAETTLPIQLEARVGEYLDLVMVLIFAFGFCFQLPVVLGILGRAGMVTSAMLSRFRRYAIVVIFIVAAIITPPDIISQVLLAVPLMALYELSIFLVRRVEKTREATAHDPA